MRQGLATPRWATGTKPPTKTVHLRVRGRARRASLFAWAHNRCVCWLLVRARRVAVTIRLMAQTIVIRLIDDIEGGEADETVSFALDGKSYEIELSKKNAAGLRKLLAPYIENGRVAGRALSHSRGRSSGSGRSSSSGTKTLFSELSVAERERFRVWANMPTARRVGDPKVQAWIDAGRP